MKKKTSQKKVKNIIKKLIPGQDKIDWKYETTRICTWIEEVDAHVVYIDLFCGFGGTTAGVAEAKTTDGKQFAIVALGINHDDIALACHKVHNERTLHLREDIRDVMLDPIKKMIATIRKKFPHIKVIIWTSAECTHHSRAKGGDSRDADSRSLAEELYRYQEAIHPDLIQVENVTEFRSWGPLEQKQFDMKLIDLRKYKFRLKDKEYGQLYSRNKSVWLTRSGEAFKKDKKRGLNPWMVPIPAQKAEYFNDWKSHLMELGYFYEDRDINAADVGAFTARNRYYGQFSSGMPIMWPEQTHCKDPEKHFLKTGIRLKKHNAVREVLDFEDTGDSVFVLGRIKSNQTFKRLTEGGIKHIAGGKELHKSHKEAYEYWMNLTYQETETKSEPKVTPMTHTPEDFLVKYNSAVPKDNNYKHSIVSVDKPSPTLPCRNMIYKPHFDYMTKYYGGNQEHMNSSMDEPASTLRTKDSHAKVHATVLPFIIQFNNNADLNSVDDPSRTITQKDKFGLAFIQQRNSGNPESKTISVHGPARTLTKTAGNQDLVQVEKILPYLSNYHGTGHNCHSINDPGPTACAADIHALVTPQPFIYRDFSTTTTNSIEEPCGSLLNIPKVNIVSPEWIMDTSYKNVGKSVDEPAQTILAGRHHAYVVNPSYFGNSSSIDRPSPVVVARQDKSPLHLAQVEYGNQTYYGIVVYNTDSDEVKELKHFMAIYGIIDIKMRMLKEMELLPIQGFPKDYIEKVRALGIKVTGTAAKKYIGNSQEVTAAKCIVEGYAPTTKVKKAA